MYKVIKKKSNTILVEMDTKTYETIKSDLIENTDSYEFKFDKPVKASSLVNS